MVRLSPKEKAKVRQYEELLAREPNVLVFAPLASLYAREYEFPKAVTVLRRGLAIFPNYFSARVLLARCHIALDDFPAAVDELEQVLSADPYNVSALGLLGDELRNRGRLAEARDHYLKILEIEPENEEYAYKLELLGTLVEGSPFAREPERVAAAPEAITAPTPEPIITEVPPEPELEPVEYDELELVELAAVEPKPPEERGPAAEEIATLTLAKIYEDQGLFVHAREVIEKVLAREPGNVAAREALEHVSGLLAGVDSPSGASVLTLIRKVEAVAGLFERDELELWEEVSAGVEEALAGFEEITLAQAIAAAAGLKSFDRFVLQDDKRTCWEFDVAGVSRALGAEGADELEVELPLFKGFDSPAGVNVAELPARASPGTAGTDEFEVVPAAGAGRGVDSFEVAGPVAAQLGARGAEDLVLDLKAELRGEKPARPPAPPPAAAEERKADDFAVKPERYRPVKPLALEREPFEKEEDFLGWLDSIRLKEL